MNIHWSLNSMWASQEQPLELPRQESTLSGALASITKRYIIPQEKNPLICPCQAQAPTIASSRPLGPVEGSGIFSQGARISLSPSPSISRRISLAPELMRQGLKLISMGCTWFLLFPTQKLQLGLLRKKGSLIKINIKMICQGQGSIMRVIIKEASMFFPILKTGGALKYHRILQESSIISKTKIVSLFITFYKNLQKLTNETYSIKW